VARDGQWSTRHPWRLVGHARRRHLGPRRSCASAPPGLWITLRRARDHKGHWGLWSLVRHRPLRAQQMAMDYGHRFGCAAGCRDATWSLGFAQARIKAMHAWARLFALCAIALLV